MEILCVLCLIYLQLKCPPNHYNKKEKKRRRTALSLPMFVILSRMNVSALCFCTILWAWSSSWPISMEQFAIGSQQHVTDSWKQRCLQAATIAYVGTALTNVVIILCVYKMLVQNWTELNWIHFASTVWVWTYSHLTYDFNFYFSPTKRIIIIINH